MNLAHVRTKAHTSVEKEACAGGKDEISRASNPRHSGHSGENKLKLILAKHATSSKIPVA